MENFSLIRLASNPTSTMGQLLNVHGAKLCVTVEDAYHAQKIDGRTRIPPGRYRIWMKPLGSSHFDAAYTRIFGDMHKGMIEIESVPGFAGILIHCGNTDLDTEGCVLVGAAVDIGPQGYQIEGGTSQPTYRKIYPLLLAAIAAGETWLDVIDKDRGDDVATS